MGIFPCLLLFPLLAYSVENAKLVTKRGLDHSSNLALLNNLSFDNKPLTNISPIPSPAPSIVNVDNPTDGAIPVTINTENLALGNPNPLPNGFQYTYAPSIPQNLQQVNPQPLDNNIIYFTGDRGQSPTIPFTNIITNGLPLIPAPSNLQNGAANTVQDTSNVLQTYIPQNVVEVPQSYPIQFIREVKVPQPYPVHITRTVQVPVQVKVPVEVPKPYAVRVPHPVPVPVHIKVPVTVEKPYPVQITKTVAVPVEKPVYIKVPQPIQVPVPQPYPVAVPQPVQIQVPFIVRLPEGQVPGILPQPPLVPNLDGVALSAPLIGGLPALPGFPELSPIIGDKPISSLGVTTESSASATSSKPVLPPVSGNGLLPPHPPSKLDPKSKEEGLLNSYVPSKEGGVYRRGTEYQTDEYKKTW